MQTLTTNIHQDKLLSAGQTAELLGIKEATLAQKRWRGDHSLPWVKLGKVIRYKVTDIQNYISINTIGKGE